MQKDPNANELNIDVSEHIDMKSGASIIFTGPEYHHGVYILFLMGIYMKRLAGKDQ